MTSVDKYRNSVLMLRKRRSPAKYQEAFSHC